MVSHPRHSPSNVNPPPIPAPSELSILPSPPAVTFMSDDIFSHALPVRISLRIFGPWALLGLFGGPCTFSMGRFGNFLWAMGDGDASWLSRENLTCSRILDGDRLTVANEIRGSVQFLMVCNDGDGLSGACGGFFLDIGASATPRLSGKIVITARKSSVRCW